ncbi:hypothetical protein M0813_14103 [Anaeramoeba flamelloides]|uniref:Transmembrane protein n=1 Tax=Anaeramoeba flamelloides TaxID=1746091 RepID=A0ABQ8Z6P9_9EUKA|nr:hypothetical protein M0813_14103 [Anaeramoeba flamelloides]
MDNNQRRSRVRNQTTWPRTTYKVFCAVGICIGILLLIRLHNMRKMKKENEMDNNETTQSKNDFTQQIPKEAILIKLEQTEIDLFLNRLNKFFEETNFKTDKDFKIKNFDLLVSLPPRNEKKQNGNSLENSIKHLNMETVFQEIKFIDHNTNLKNLQEKFQHEYGSFLSININSLPLNTFRLLNSFQEAALQTKPIFAPSQSPCTDIQPSNEKKQNSNPDQDPNNIENLLILSDCKIYKLSNINPI